MYISKKCSIFAAQNENKNTMSYMQMAQLDVLNLVKGIQTEGDYIDFRSRQSAETNRCPLGEW